MVERNRNLSYIQFQCHPLPPTFHLPSIDAPTEPYNDYLDLFPPKYTIKYFRKPICETSFPIIKQVYPKRNCEYTYTGNAKAHTYGSRPISCLPVNPPAQHTP